MENQMLMDIEQDNSALATRDQVDQALSVQGPVVSLLPVKQMREVLAEYDSRRVEFRNWLLSMMTEGVHYGVPPGCEVKRNSAGEPIDFQGKVIRSRQWRSDKPSLYKAGADLLCDLFMLKPSFAPDHQAWEMLGSPAGTVVVNCTLEARNESPFFPGWRKGDVVGNGHGAAASGVKRRDANGALKMAEKCAKVGAIIHTLGISDLFSQDIEDEIPAPSPAPDPDRLAPRVGTRAERAQSQAAPDDGTPRVTADMLNNLLLDWRKAKAPNGTLAEFRQWARSVLRTESRLERPADFSIDSIDVCREALK